MLLRILPTTILCLAITSIGIAGPTTRPSFSGIYPHLAYFNEQNECGTGAVVPWADRLWVVTYGPHLPNGSSDKLYEISPDLTAIARPESIGGTPANRMIHRESNQLFIGPYAIDAERRVRAIPYKLMPGRHTGTMRHLIDPANKVYYATMEEGFYEVDVHTLVVKELYPDANGDKGGHAGTLLPGYHGKGAYSGQGRVIYANNGELSSEAMRKPDIPSGCLAEWDGRNWTVIRRNQFCDVAGPGGIYGNTKPESDPVWSIGWDHRSLILMVLDAGTWHAYRLPKATHTYDGAHGWNTEWPRIRDIGEADLLMTMHGMFWRFPRTFTASNSAGIKPRSSYLKVIGDFCRWNDRLVFGCDDAAKSEFLNKRKAKGGIDGPGQSQSNLWFVDPPALDAFGPTTARGGPWVHEDVKGGEWSEPFLFTGWTRRGLHLAHGSPQAITFELQIDPEGKGKWSALKSVTIPANGYEWVTFTPDQSGQWIRMRANRDCQRATALFQYPSEWNPPPADGLFDGISGPKDANVLAGLIRARGENKRTLHLAAQVHDGQDATDAGYYELDGDMKLRKVDDPQAHRWLTEHVAIPKGVLSADAASVLYVDDAGKRRRLPRGDAAFDELTGRGLIRIDREVVTERDLFNAHGTFYELPAENAGGFAKIRPIATHNRRIVDYCSYRGMLVMTGVEGGEGNPHIIRSNDGKAAVWVGVIDDLWKLGKPHGQGGPWKDSAVKANVPSDPYLMSGYDRKRLTLSHDQAQPVSIRMQIDINGDGLWLMYRSFEVPAGVKLSHEMPAGFQAYWVRFVAASDCAATAWLVYE